MRERGLKHCGSPVLPPPGRSLPVRERGLKPVRNHVRSVNRESLPVRERGLKLLFKLLNKPVLSRSPCGSVD